MDTFAPKKQLGLRDLPDELLKEILVTDTTALVYDHNWVCTRWDSLLRNRTMLVLKVNAGVLSAPKRENGFQDTQDAHLKHIINRLHPEEALPAGALKWGCGFWGKFSMRALYFAAKTTEYYTPSLVAPEVEPPKWQQQENKETQTPFSAEFSAELEPVMPPSFAPVENPVYWIFFADKATQTATE